MGTIQPKYIICILASAKFRSRGYTYSFLKSINGPSGRAPPRMANISLHTFRFGFQCRSEKLYCKNTCSWVAICSSVLMPGMKLAICAKSGPDTICVCSARAFT